MQKQKNNEKPKTTFSQFLNNKFEITKRNSTIKTEVVGGVVSFLVLVYVMVVIPNILTGGLGGTAFWNAVYLATLLSIIVTTFFMGIGANMPLVSAPGIGLVSYFATLIANGTYNYSQTITIALISGVFFVFLTIIGFRNKLINGIPNVLKNAIPAGIGLFILNIGLNASNSGILNFLTHGPLFEHNGQAVWVSALVALFGFVIILVLHHKKVKGAIFVGILGATVLHMCLQFVFGINPFLPLVDANWLPPFEDFANLTFMQFDFKGVFLNGTTILSGVLTAILITFSYTLVNLFDTVGTLFGATKGTELVNEKGEIVNLNRAFWVDSGSTIWGAFLGVPGCTVYVESSAGIQSGSRTGLSSLVVAGLFVLALFLSPLFMLIPAAATAPALMFVGVSMFSAVKEIDFSDITQFVPALFTIIIMPLTNNISYGIGAGLILYVSLMIFARKARKVNWVTYLLAALFLIFFLTQNIM